METCACNLCAVRDGDGEGATKAAVNSNLHLWSTEEKAVWEHLRAWYLIWHHPMQKRRRTRAIASDKRLVSWM